ncbi:MAG: 30S ribosomal protein S16 [Bacteroidia bacterium]|nr:30S ribosomal protein S16 [Bacteroidia bacterium]
MAVKIRLARKGRKKLAYYHIVVADSRSPRDGRYIEKIGKYNPLTNPASIELNFDKALGWLQNGALPTETCRAILSYKGVLIKKHLLEGVKKGAFDDAEATKRFDEWMKQNEAKIEAKKSGLEKSKDDEVVRKLAAEKKINEARAAKLAKKQAELAAKAEAAANQPEAPAEETAPAEVTAPVETAAPVEETAPLAETTDVPAVEAPPSAETTDAPVKDEAASEPAAEEKPQE